MGILIAMFITVWQRSSTSSQWRVDVQLQLQGAQWPRHSRKLFAKKLDERPISLNTGCYSFRWPVGHVAGDDVHVHHY